jgi:hypothetical protein
VLVGVLSPNTAATLLLLLRLRLRARRLLVLLLLLLDGVLLTPCAAQMLAPSHPLQPHRRCTLLLAYLLLLLMARLLIHLLLGLLLIARADAAHLKEAHPRTGTPAGETLDYCSLSSKI